MQFNIEETIVDLRETMEELEGEKSKVLIAGDFNARIGEAGMGIERVERRSEDKVENREGRKLIQFMQSKQ